MSCGHLIKTYEIEKFKYICVGYDYYKLMQYKSISQLDKQQIHLMRAKKYY